MDAAPLQLARGERSYEPLLLLRLTASLSLWERSSCSHVVAFTSGSDQSQTPGVSKLGLGDVSQLALGLTDSCEDAPGSRSMNFCAHHDCGEGMRLRRGSGGLDALPRVRARVKRSGCRPAGKRHADRRCAVHSSPAGTYSASTLFFRQWKSRQLML